MESSKIALFTEYFNILSVTAAAFLALYGVITLFWKNSSLNIFRGRLFIQAFCVAALPAFVLEVTVFNFQHYLKYAAGAEFRTMDVSPQDSTVILTTDTAVTAKMRAEFHVSEVAPRGPATVLAADTDTAVTAQTPKEFLSCGVSSLGPAAISAAGNAATVKPRAVQKDSAIAVSWMTFENINRKISSIYIEPIFGGAEFFNVRIRATDKEGTTGFPVTVHKGFPRDNYIPLQLSGEVSELAVIVYGEDLLGRISHVAVNKPIPFYFSGLRLLAVTCLLFILILLLRKELRAKVSYFLFEYKFEPSDKRQNAVYAFAVALVLIFSFITVFTSTSKFFREEYLNDRQYNVFLVDALLAGRTYLDFGRPEMLQIAERPYDLTWLKLNNFPVHDWWHPDWAYYEGKFYCYFGVVPAVILYAPYKLITGEYLSNNAGIFIFMAVAIVLMALLWRYCVKRYMPNAVFVFYLLGFLTLFFASALFVPLRFTRFYSIVSAGGFMFIIAGIFLLLKSVEHGRPKNLKVFFACLCFALAVGCRPNLALVSIIVPVVLWRYKSFKLAAVILLPYTLIAIPLCYYNYIRFDSYFEFGAKYNLTSLNIAAYNLTHPIGKIINAFKSSVVYLFSINRYSFAFPYVECVPHNDKLSFISKQFQDKGSGMINFPIVFCLYFYFKSVFAKVKPESFSLPSVFLVIAAATVAASSWLIGHSGRYTIDFAFFIIFASIFGAYYWCDSKAGCISQERNRLKAVYVLLSASIFVGLMLFAGNISNDPSPSDPVLYRYLRYSLGLIGSV